MTQSVVNGRRTVFCCLVRSNVERKLRKIQFLTSLVFYCIGVVKYCAVVWNVSQTFKTHFLMFRKEKERGYQLILATSEVEEGMKKKLDKLYFIYRLFGPRNWSVNYRQQATVLEIHQKTHLSIKFSDEIEVKEENFLYYVIFHNLLIQTWKMFCTKYNFCFSLSLKFALKRDERAIW